MRIEWFTEEANKKPGKVSRFFGERARRTDFGNFSVEVGKIGPISATFPWKSVKSD